MPPDSDYLSAATREQVAQRANHRCEYCLCPDEFSPDSFTIDHIYPRALGGGNNIGNLAWACFGCNGRKHSKTSGEDPQTQNVVNLFNPRQQSWVENFRWLNDELILMGKTSCARATIETLSLNRAGVVNLRSLLKLAGLHPPSIIY